MRLNILIVDDEPLSRLRLAQLCDDLQADCPNQVLAQYAHGSALINALPHWQHQHQQHQKTQNQNSKQNQNQNHQHQHQHNQHNQHNQPCITDIRKDIPNDIPDVILLDINMPGLNGVDIAAFLNQHLPHIAIVFVTAEPEHALAAFEVAALDYVLKPVRPARLLASLHKAVAHKQARLSSLEQLKQAFNPALPPDTQLTVHTATGAIALPISQVIYFKAAHKTTLVRTQTAQYSSHLSLGELEQWLDANQQAFIRVHRNALLRINACGELSAQGSDYVVQVLGIDTNEYLHVSRRMLAALRAVMGL